MTTGFYTEGSGLQQDVDFHFDPGDAGINTGFVTGYRSGSPDLGRIFSPLADGERVSFNTGYIATNGLDLSDCFCAKGTTVPAWPVGSGFVLYQNGGAMQITGAVQALAGRMSWSISGASPSDTALPNAMADFNFVCPGAARANAGLWQDNGSFSRSAQRRLPAGAVLRFQLYCSGLGGVATVNITAAVGTTSPGWTAVNNGAVPLCSSAAPYYSDVPNLLAFSPPVNTYFGMVAPSLTYGHGRSWTINVSSVFITNIANSTLNEQFLTITRTA